MNDTIPTIGQLIEPADVRFSFDTPGWYVVGGSILLFILVSVFFAWRHYRRNHYRRAAICWLQKEEQRLSATNEWEQLVYTSDMLVKRIAMQRYGREISSLRGKEWLDYINRTWRSAFTADDAKLLDDLYASTGNIDAHRANSFVDKTKHWIKTHRYES